MSTPAMRLLPRVKLLCAVVSACFATQPFANPVGPSVVAGQASFASAGKSLTVSNSPNAIINWQGFSIGAGEITRFQQQSAASAVLNRVVGQDPSAILGTLSSNGKVYLINPNGILFGQGSRVDVAGLVASTLNLSNNDFLAGRLNFESGAVANSILNQGEIVSASGGRILLIAPDVQNHGLISSPQGEVVLAAGKSVQLVEADLPMLKVEVQAGGEALNVGKIVAEGGKIGVYAGLINQRGVVRADSASVDASGKVVFRSSDTTLLEAGSVTSASGAKGGEVQVLGNKVGLLGDAKVDASGEAGGGTVLIGGDLQGKNPEVPNAFRTYFGPDATIKADAITSGDGGKVIVWSDDATRAYGTISARGGAQSGNGGFVEVSSKNWLDFAASVNTSAAKGASGALLLDPMYVQIVSGSDAFAGGAGFDGGNPDNVFSGGTDQSQISWTTIKDLLTTTPAGGTNVIVTTTGNCSLSGSCGNIDIIDPSPELASANMLRLLAHNDINVNGSITNNTGSGALEMYAGWDGASTTTPVVTSSRSININQPVSVAGTVVLIAGSSIIQTAPGVITAAGLNAQAGREVSLDQADNMIDVVAGSALNCCVVEFNVRNAKPLIIGTVAGTSGITTTSGDGSSSINVNVTSGSLTIDQPVSAEFGPVAGAVTLSALGAVNVNANVSAISGSGPVTITGGSITIDNSAAVSNTNTGGGTSVQLTANNGGITVQGGSVVVATSGGGGAANVTMTVTAPDNGITVSNGTIQATGADGSAGADFAGGTNGVAGGAASITLTAGPKVSGTPNVDLSSATLTATGGVGGAGFSFPTSTVNGGAGGAGGSATIQINSSNDISSLGHTITATGGNAGAGGHTSVSGALGGTGGAGGTASVTLMASGQVALNSAGPDITTVTAGAGGSSGNSGPGVLTGVTGGAGGSATITVQAGTDVSMSSASLESIAAGGGAGGSASVVGANGTDGIGTVSLTATAGSIQDTDSASLLTARSPGTHQVQLSAATGIGQSGLPIHIDGNSAETPPTVTATNSTSGDIVLAQTTQDANLATYTVSNVASGIIDITAESGDLTDGGFTFSASGPMILRVLDPAKMLRLESFFTFSAPDITLIADNMGLTGSVDAGSGTVRLQPKSTTRSILIESSDTFAGLSLTPIELQNITAGTLEIGLSTHTGTLTVNSALTSTEVTAGTLKLAHQNLQINQPISLTNANLILAAGAGGAVSLAADLSVGTGTIDASTSTVNLSGTRNITSTNVGTGFSVATLDIGTSITTLDANTSVDTLNLPGGQLGGSGNVTVNTAMNWSNAADATVTGAGSIDVNGVLTMSGAGAKVLDGRTLTHNNSSGTSAWDGEGPLVLNNGAIFRNWLTGIFAFAGGGPSATIDNGAGAAGVFDNEGELDVLAGPIVVGGSGAVTLTNSGTVNIVSGSLVIVDGYSGVGTTSIGGGTLTVAAPSSTGTLLLQSNTGVLDGAGTFTVDTLMDWTDGTMSGAGTTAMGPGSVLSVSGAGGKVLSGGRTLDIFGNAVWTGGAAIDMQNANVILRSGSLFDVQADGRFFDATSGASPNTITVQSGATLRKSGGTGLSEQFGSVAPQNLNNDGTVEVQTGTLEFAGASHSGTFDVAPGAFFNFHGGANALQDGATFTGGGDIGFVSGAGGGLSFAGTSTGATLTSGTTFTLNGIAVGGSGIFTNQGTLALDSTTISGTLVNDGILNLNGGTLSLANGATHTGTFSIASGATLAFTGGTHDLNAGGISGDAVSVPGGTVNIGAATSYGVQDTSVSGGTINFNTNPGTATTDTLTLSAGSVGGTGNLTIATDFVQTGGTFGSTFNNLSITKATGDLDSSTLGATNSLSLTASSGQVNVNAPINQAGSATLVGATGVNVNSTITAGGNVLLDAQGASADVIIAADVSKTSGADATLEVRAGRDIRVSSGVGISSSLNKLHVILNSDRDGVGGGGISLASGSSISSNGGDVTLGGGADPLLNPAESASGGVAVLLSGTGIDAGAGNISIRGQGQSGSFTAGGVGMQSGAVLQTTTGSISIVGAGKTGGISGLNHGIFVDGIGTRISSAQGAISLTGTGGNATNSGAASSLGVVIQAGAVVESTGTGATAATITMTGMGGTSVDFDANRGISISGAGTTVTSVDGAISITGTGGGTAGTGGRNTGIDIRSGAVVESTGSSTVTMIGMGGTSVDTGINSGVHISGTGTRVSSVSGAIDVTGTGGGGNATSLDGNRGIDIETGAIVESTGAATITLRGTGGTSVDGGINEGITLRGLTPPTVRSVDGAITMIGAGGTSTGTGGGNRGIDIFAGSVVESTGSGTISMTGTGGASLGGNDSGIYVSGTGTVVRSVSGAISLTGTGVGDPSGTVGANRGIAVYDGALVESTGTGAGAATIAMTGTGGTSLGANNEGIDVQDAGTIVRSVDGAITLTGTGGGAPAGTAGSNQGITIFSGAVVESTGLAAIRMTGTGGASLGGNDSGIYVSGTGTVVRSVSGAISLTGTGVGDPSGTVGANRGIAVYGGALVESTGTGAGAATIAMTGTGGTSLGANNEGIDVQDNGTIVRSVDGAITLTGTGGGAPAGNGSNQGITIFSGAVVESIGLAAISMTGTGGASLGGSDFGISVSGTGTVVRSVSGAINLDGTGLGAGPDNQGVVLDSATVESTSNAPITIVGAGAGGAAGISIIGTSTTVSGGSGLMMLSATGDLSIEGNGISVSTTSGSQTLDASGNVTVTASGGSVNVSSGGTQSVTTTGAGNLVLTGGLAASETATVQSTGLQTFNLAGGLTVQSLATGDVTATATVSSSNGQSITAKYVEVLADGAASASITNAAGAQSITTTGMNASNEGLSIRDSWPNSVAAITNNGLGTQTITVNDADQMRIVGGATGGAYLVSSGNQTILVQGAASQNQIDVGGNVAQGESHVHGNNQSVTAGTGVQSGGIVIQGGVTDARASLMISDAGTQTISTSGDMLVIGGTSTGPTGAQAQIINNGTGLQSISANAISLSGGDGAGVASGHAIIQTNSLNTAGQSITVGTGGLSLTGGSGTGGNNSADINHTGTIGTQTITMNGGNVVLLGGTGAANNSANVFNAGTAQTLDVTNGNLLSVVAQAGDASINSSGVQTITMSGTGNNAIEIGSATAVGSSSIVTTASQAVTAGLPGETGSIAITGSVTDGKMAHLLVVTGGTTQAVSTAGAITLIGGSAPGVSGTTACTDVGSCANITNNGTGLQQIDAHAISVQGGASGGFNIAGIFSRGDGGQTITIDGAGGSIGLQGGAGAVGTNYAGLSAGLSTGDQSIDFTASGGSITLDGGTVGSNNFARVSTVSGAQTITGSPTITLTGGPSGGVDGGGNFAQIRVSAGTQDITAGTVTLNAGLGGTNNFAVIEAPSQNIIVHGDLSLTGGASNPGTVGAGARIGGLGGASPTNTSLDLTVDTNVTLTGGSLANAGAAIGSAGLGAPTPVDTSMNIQVGFAGSGDLTLVGNTSGVRIGSPGTGVGAGDIDLGVNGNVAMNGPASIRTLGGVTLNAVGDLLLTAGTGASQAAIIESSNGQTVTALTIDLSGGNSGTGNHARMTQLGSSANQTIAADAITLTGGADGGGLGTGNFAQIRSNGNQDLTVASGGLWLTGGGGSLTGNFASIYQAGTGGTGQTITVNAGGSVTLTAGSSSGAGFADTFTGGSFAFIRADGATQNINVNGGGAIDVAGGTVGSNNDAGIYSPSATQVITGAPDITLQGGATGGASGQGNVAVIGTESGAQSIAASDIKLFGGGGAENLASIYASGTQTIGATSIELSAGGSGSVNVATINQNSTSANQAITVTGGDISLIGGSGGTSNYARIRNEGPSQAVSANGFQLSGGADGGGFGTGNRASIQSSGSQTLDVGAGGLSLTGGGGSLSDNAALVEQLGATGTQTIDVSGGSIVLVGGSSAGVNVGGTGHGSRASIYSEGTAQQINFIGGGTLTLTGGTVGSRNFAQIFAENSGAQSITGAPAITLTGGASGGYADANLNIHEGNSAYISTRSGTQDIDASAVWLKGGSGGLENYALLSAGNQQTLAATSLRLDAGSGGTDNFAAVSAPTQFITVLGNVDITGGNSVFGTRGVGARIGGPTDAPTALTLDAGGNVTLTGSAVNSGAVIGSSGISSAQTTDIAMTAGGSVTLNGGSGAGSRLGSSSAAVGGGAISVTAVGDISLGDATPGVGTGIFTTGSVLLKTTGAASDINMGGVITTTDPLDLSTGGITLDAGNAIVATSPAMLLSASMEQTISLKAVNGIGTQASPIRINRGDNTGPDILALNTTSGDIALSFATGDVVINGDLTGFRNDSASGTYSVNVENGNFRLDIAFTPGSLPLLAGQSVVVTAPMGSVTLNSGGSIAATGSGSVTLTAGNASAAGLSNGVLLDGGTVSTQTGDITITGQGKAGTSFARGVLLTNGAIAQTASGAIDVTGTGGDGTGVAGGRNTGIQLIGSGTRISAGDGSIALTGAGGNSSGVDTAAGSDDGLNRGIFVASGAAVETTGTSTLATITLDGTGGASVAWGQNSGILIDGSGGTGTRVSSVNGNILLTGFGGTNTGVTATNGANRGVSVGGLIQSTGTGSITIDGTGGSSVNSDATSTNSGILVQGQPGVFMAAILTAGGNITIDGTRGTTNGVAGGNQGILINDGVQIQSGGTGMVTLNASGDIVLTAGDGPVNLLAGGDQIVATDTNFSATAGTGSGASISLQATGLQAISANNITLTGGAGGSGNIVEIQQTGSGNPQVITVNNGGTLALQGGGGTSNWVEVASAGTSQTILFDAGGTLSLTGGPSGQDNGAYVFKQNGTQLISGNTADPAIVLQGGGGGTTGNDASIGSILAAQTLSASSLTLTAGAGNSAYATIGGDGALSTTLNVTGATLITGGSGDDAAAAIGSNISNVNITLNAGGPVTLTGGTGIVGVDGLGALAAIGATGTLTANVTVNGQSSVTLIKGGAPGFGDAFIGSQAGAGTVTLKAGLGGTGDLALNDGLVGTTGTLTLQASAPGAQITQGATGGINAGSLSATANSGISLLGINDAGTASLNTASGNATINDVNALVLGSSAVGGSLTVNASGAITQTGAITAGAGSFNAGSNAITLTNAGNDFTGAVTLTGSSAAVTDATALNLGSTALGSGSLAVNAGGAITQTGAITAGAGSFNAGSNAITLTNAANEFTGAVSLTGSSAAVTDATALNLGNTALGGGSLVVATAGAITQSGAITAGAASFNAGANPITLTNAANDFTGAVSLTGTDVSITDANALTLAAVSASFLTVNAASIDQDASGIVVSGTATLNAGTISLTSGTNDFGTVVATSGGNVAITDANAITIASSSVGGSFDVTSLTGAVNFSGGLSASNYSFSSGNYTLQSGTYSLAGTTSVANGATVAVQGGAIDASSGTLNVDGTLQTTSGSVSAGTMNVGGVLDASGGSVSAGTLNVLSGGTLKGTGSVTANVSNSGTVAPGASPGILTINGNYVQSNTGLLLMEIGGLTPGAGGYDQLNVTGNVTLGGTLTATLTNGFVPPGSSSYTLIQAGGTLSGTFAAVNQPTGTTFDTFYGPTTYMFSIPGASVPPQIAPPLNEIILQTTTTEPFVDELQQQLELIQSLALEPTTSTSGDTTLEKKPPACS